MGNVTTFTDVRVATPAELRARSNVVVQAWRFIVLNWKMVAMVRKGHS